MTDTDYRKLLSEALPDLTIGNRLGKGGQGLVFCAEGADGRKIACKVLFAGRVENAERFDNEIAALKGLEHPNVVPIIGNGVLRGEHGKVPYLLMPRIDGMPIGDDFKNHRRSVGACVKFFLQICDALSYAHKRDVIHRDMKPGNILIDSSNGTLGGRAWVVDFGMALAAGEKPDPNTSSAWKHAATLCYMSPEQVDGQSLDARTDIYSLGVVMYELLSDGGFPYPIHDATPVRIIGHIWKTVPASLRIVNPSIDSRLSNVVHKCLEKDRERRYGSMDELRADLKRWQDGKAVKARSDTRWHHMKKTARRHKLAVAVAAIIAGLSVFSTFMWQRSERLAATYSAGLGIYDLVQRGSDARAEGRTDEALALWHEALELDASAPVRNAAIDRMSYEVLHRLCEFHLFDKHAELARGYCADAVAVAEQYADHPGWRRRAGFAEILRGRVALADKDPQAGLQAFSRAVVIMRESVEEEQDSADRRAELAAVLSLTARTYRKLKLMDESRDCYEEEHEIRSALHEAYPRSADHALNLANACAHMCSWHMVQRSADHDRQALEWITRAQGQLSDMQADGLWDDRPGDCRLLDGLLGRNRDRVQKRLDANP